MIPSGTVQSILDDITTEIKKANLIGYPINARLNALIDCIVEDVLDKYRVARLYPLLLVNPVSILLRINDFEKEIKLQSAFYKEKELIEELPKAQRQKKRFVEPEIKDWQQTMTKDELNWIWEQFDQITQGYDCCDNYRAARIWISSQRRRYRKLQNRGCCGFYDDIVFRWNPSRNDYDIYMIGFNHGH